MRGGKNKRSLVLISIGLYVVFLLNFSKVLWAEISDKVPKEGSSLFEVIVNGEMRLVSLGIFLSILGLAWILYLIFGSKDA